MTDIIPQLLTKQQQPKWQHALHDLFTNPLALLTFLELDPNTLPWAIDPNFPLRVPRRFAQQMKKGDPYDPLLWQVLSTQLESRSDIQYKTDPLQENRFNPLPGLLHKYTSRVLITFTPTCAVHCRYCFRRHFPYDQNHLGRQGWAPLLEYIARDPAIIEVILSGGDPLFANDDTIRQFLEALAPIAHVKLLRFHTRLPVMIPERIHNDFVALLADTRFTTTMVYHINHPNEIQPDIIAGVQRLRTRGITVLNQSVLLNNINNSVECLSTLSLALYHAGILPYYLHLLDPVHGTQHFDVSYTEAKHLENALRQRLPGFLVPRFVREIAGEQSKIPL